MISVDENLIAMAKLTHHPRITTDAFDSEIESILQAGLLDLTVSGVVVPDEDNALVTRALMTYFQLHFGEPDDPDRLLASYEMQKSQMITATGYTDWGRANG